MYLLTVLSAMLMPSLSNSPWMRAHPKWGFRGTFCGSDHGRRGEARVSPGGPAESSTPRADRSHGDARQAPFRVERWPAPSASRSKRGRAKPTADGPVESTWGDLVRSVEERRFGAGEPGSLTQGQRANARSKTRWQGVSQEK